MLFPSFLGELTLYGDIKIQNTNNCISQVLKPKIKAMYFFDSTHPYGIGDVKYVTVFRLHLHL